MRRCAAALVLLALLTTAAPRATAWNEVGHMIVAKRAFDELDGKTRTTLFDLLKQHPHFKDFLSADQPADAHADEWAFLRAAVWPDWVRPRANDPKSDPRGERVTKYHRAEDHYINFPFPAPGYTGKGRSPDPDKGDILSAYKERMNELQTKNASAEDKAVALCWIIHLVGDVHQPLHTVGLFSDEYPRGDLGANLVGVSVDGRGVKLHAFWDNLLGEVGYYADDSAKRQVELYNHVAKVERDVKMQHSRDSLKAELTKGTFPSWAQESFALAREKGYVYNGKLLDHVVVKGDTVPNDAPKLEDAYRQAALEIARRRVALAGSRLADKLRRAHVVSAP